MINETILTNVLQLSLHLSRKKAKDPRETVVYEKSLLFLSNWLDLSNDVLGEEINNEEFYRRNIFRDI